MNGRGGLRCSRRQRGQIVVLFMLGLLTLVALMVSVFNTGDFLSERIRVRNAADAAAIAQGSWAARSLNVMSMNNVAMTQTQSLVAISEALLAVGSPLLPQAFSRLDEYLSCGWSCSGLAAHLSAALIVPLGRVVDDARQVRSRFTRLTESLRTMNERIADDFAHFSAAGQSRLARRNGLSGDDVRFFAPFSVTRDDGTDLPVRVAGDNLGSFCLAGEFGTFGPVGEPAYFSHGYTASPGGPLRVGIRSAEGVLDFPLQAAGLHGLAPLSDLGVLARLNWGRICSGLQVYQLAGGGRWQVLAFTRLERRGARLMPSLFEEPAQALYGHAQVSLDNVLQSADLYTPGWQARLSPSGLLADPGKRDDIARAVQDFGFLADAVRAIDDSDLGFLDAH